MAKTQKQNAAALSKFFLLYPSEKGHVFEAVARYDSSTIGVPTFWSGEPFDGPFPPKLVQLTDGRATDCLGNPMSWMIVSIACADLLASHVAGHAQIVTLPVTLADGTVDSKKYAIINPLGVVDAIYAPGKQKSNVTLLEMVIAKAKVPSGANIFRLKHSESTIVVTSSLVQIIQKNNLEGFAASPLKVH